MANRLSGWLRHFMEKSLIVKIVAFLAALVTVLGAAFFLFKVLIPAPVAIVVWVLFFVLGWWLRTKAIAKSPSNMADSFSEIRFLSTRPEQDGWRIGGEQEGGNRPHFYLIEDGLYGNALRILPKGRYYMDRQINKAEYPVASVVFVVERTEVGVPYVHVMLRSQDGSATKRAWLEIRQGNFQPQPFEDGTIEWKVFVEAENQAGRWVGFRVNLRDAVAQTFGKEGWKYDGLIAFRLRGQMTIACIRMLRE